LRILVWKYEAYGEGQCVPELRFKGTKRLDEPSRFPLLLMQRLDLRMLDGKRGAAIRLRNRINVL
jgi:hypothetical protein